MKKNSNKNNRNTIIVSRLLFAIYMIGVIYFMFFAEGFGRTNVSAGYRYNVIPFSEIKRFSRMIAAGYSFKACLNLTGNVIAFIPFGLFLPMMKRNRVGLPNVVILSFLFSVFIETIQLYFRLGVFDVDDIILNTLGGLIGYLGYLIGKAWCRK